MAATPMEDEELDLMAEELAGIYASEGRNIRFNGWEISRLRVKKGSIWGKE